jgi:hypothetical protein
MKKAESAPVKTGLLALLGGAWETAKSLFSPWKADETLRKRIPEADLRAALLISGAAVILGAVLYLLIYAETLYFAAFSYTALSKAVGGPVPQPDFSSLDPFAVFLLLSAALTLLLGFFQDGIVYYALRLTGGKGTFTQQYYLSSFVALAMAISSSIMVFGPVPCLGAPVALAYLVMVLYFMFVVRCRAYATVHDLTYTHVLIVVFLSCIPLVVILFLGQGALASTLHIQQAQLYNLSSSTNVTSGA